MLSFLIGLFVGLPLGALGLYLVIRDTVGEWRLGSETLDRVIAGDLVL